MDDIQYLQSALLAEHGINHGWFMRYGGVSSGLFKSLNGKKGNGDSDENVDENRLRAIEALINNSSDKAASQLAHIMHSFGTNILHAKSGGEFEGFDASFTLNKDVVLSQTTADCGTVIIASVDGSVVSLVHGSWHTLRDKIICKTVAKLKEYTESELIAGLGPMICQKCYEFGPEAADLFEPRYLKLVDEKYHVDLKSIIIDQLEESGITQIDDINICTKEDNRFFSHRRNGANSGRFITLVSPIE